MPAPGRNDPCPCGSGRKYKKCCLATRETSPPAGVEWQRMRRTEGELINPLMKHAEKYYGPAAFAEAWDEFSGWNDVPMDPEAEPECDTVFLSWFLYNWEPDNTERDKKDHLPGMPVAVHYMKHRGSRLDSYRRRFIEEICSRELSFHLVTGVVPGKQISLRDLMLQQDVTVHEQTASGVVKTGQIVFCRIVTMDGDSIIMGFAPTPLPSMVIDTIIGFRERIADYMGVMDHGTLHEYDIELRNFYYMQRDQVLNPAPPQLENTDGDPIQLTKLQYTLRCTAREALEALVTLSMEKDVSRLLNYGEFNEQGELVSIDFPWLMKGNKRNASWDNTVLGHIAIDGDTLTVEVNSRERAEAIQRKLKYRLGKRAVFQNSVIDSLEKAFEERAKRPPASDPIPDPEGRRVIQKMADQHWQTWPDISLPALQGKTPREAAKTSLGRERLHAMLLDFESRSNRQDVFGPDLKALRKELGID